MQYLDFEKTITAVDDKLARLSAGEKALMDKNQLEKEWWANFCLLRYGIYPCNQNC